MATDVIVNLKVDGVQTTVRDVEDLDKAIVTLEESLKDLGNNPEKFAKVSKELEKAKAATKSFDKEITKLNPKEKAAKFEQMGQGISGGFKAATGALQAFGGENEILTELEEKSEGAVRLAMGARHLASSGLLKDLKKTKAATLAATAAQKVYTFVMSASTKGLKFFRGALIATGIGAIIVGIGLLVANWEKMTNAIKENTEGWQKFKKVLMFVLPPIWLIIEGIEVMKEKFGSLEAFVKGTGAAIQNFFDAVGGLFAGESFSEAFGDLGEKNAKAYADAMEAAMKKAAREIQKASLDASVIQNEAILKVAQARGIDTVNLERQILADKLAVQDEGDEKYMEAALELAVFDAKQAKAKQDAQDKATEEWVKNQEVIKKAEEAQRIEKEKLEAEYLQKITDMRTAQREADKEREAAELEKDRQNAQLLVELKTEQALLDSQSAFETAQIQLDVERAERLAGVEAHSAAETAIKKIYFDKQNDLTEAKAEFEKGVETDLVLAKLGAAKQGLTALGGIFEKNAKIQKGVAIGSATISAIEGSINAFTSAAKSPITIGFPGYPSVMAGIAAAAGLASVAKIASTPINGGGGGASISSIGGSTSGGGAASFTPPEQPQIDFGFLGEGDTQNSFRAYVIESEISTEQGKQQKLDELVSI